MGRCLYVDNYYTSPPLLAELYRQNTGACGTAHYRKGIPQKFKTAQVKKKGDKFLMDNGTLLAVKFKDHSVFQMLSSVHSVADVEVGQNHPRTGLQIAKPEIIHDYNKFKGAVDRCDQMVAYSCLRRNTMKWWKKVFFHLFSLSILNASILYKQRTHSPGCKGPLKRSLLRTLASPILSLREATQGGQPKAPPIFKLEVTSQRKYWAPGRSPTSPRHVGFAFLSKRRF